MKITVLEHHTQGLGSKPTDSEIESILSDSNYGGHGDPDYRDPDYAERLEYVKGVLHGLQFPLRVWRGLRVPSGKELRIGTDVGTHWTYNYAMFDNNTSGEWFSRDKLNVILSGVITDGMVNWKQTIIDLASDYDPHHGGTGKNAEYEMELKRGIAPDEIEIWADYR